MRRTEIPDALLRARRADIDRISDPVLAKMTRTQLTERLVAAGEFRCRAHEPRLDADLFRLRLGQASEVLATSDLKRAADLVKAAGVGVTIAAGSAARPAAGTRVTKSAPVGTTIRYPALDILTAKATAARSVATALIELAKAGRLADLERDIGAMRRDVGSGRTELVRERVSGLVKSVGAAPLSKAAEYEAKANVVTDPQLARGYRELAAQERQRAGAA